MQEVFEKIDAILQKYRKKWLEQPNTEPCKGLECISNDCVDCKLTHLENDINQVAEEYRTTMGQVKCDTSFSDGYIKAIDDAIEKILEYGCFLVEWNPKLSKENLVTDVLRQVKGQAVYNLEKMKQKEIDSVNQVAEEYVEKTYKFGKSEQVINQSLTNNNQSLTNGGWIPCSVGLPADDKEAEYYQSVIVTLDDGRVAEGCYRNRDKEWWVDAPDGEHYSQDMTGHVIAWQPLPEPYKPEGE